MICTINTDASWHSKEKIGAYAFWIVCNKYKIQKSGVLQKKCNKSDEAEVKSILNALHLVFADRAEIHKTIVNTDCTNAINILRNDKKEIKKYRLQFGNYLRDYFNKNFKDKGIEIEFRWVKAHTDTSKSRKWVNDWCDKKAKESLWIALNK